jgi:hypothetical protein
MDNHYCAVCNGRNDGGGGETDEQVCQCHPVTPPFKLTRADKEFLRVNKIDPEKHH